METHHRGAQGSLQMSPKRLEPPHIEPLRMTTKCAERMRYGIGPGGGDVPGNFAPFPAKTLIPKGHGGENAV